MELFTPSFGLVFWMFVSFAVLFFILWKFAWPMILTTMDSRADLIDKGVEYAQNAKEQLEAANSSAEKIIGDARRQEAEILRQAETLKNRIVESAKDQAKEEARKEAVAAQQAIDQERKQAEKNIRNQIGQVALEIAEKVLKNNLDNTDAQKALVNNLLDEIETKN